MASPWMLRNSPAFSEGLLSEPPFWTSINSDCSGISSCEFSYGGMSSAFFLSGRQPNAKFSFKFSASSFSKLPTLSVHCRSSDSESEVFS
uniref:Uncharacterized protein n=1 Tax=Arundo donax TaxID=35708 RepID=A0A0A9GUW3_ARUDO